MSRSTVVPITPSVLRWAIDESGYTASEIAEDLDLPSEKLDGWLAGKGKPTLSEARPLASKLKRPLASLLLPTPPQSQLPAVQFRRTSTSARRRLNPTELLRIRQAGRLQQLLTWIQRELGIGRADIDQFSVTDDAEYTAEQVRSSLGFDVRAEDEQWSASSVWHSWRGAIEDRGVFVFSWSMGTQSCRGFSIWDEYAPLIVINASSIPQARTFTLAHEFAHLLTRTNSACLESPSRRRGPAADSVERWCESFAAALLLPAERTTDYLKHLGAGEGANLATVTRVARHFRVSLRAAAIRLIELGYAKWSLYRSIPPASDTPQRGGRGGGRTRAQIRIDQYGERTIDAFSAAVRSDVISQSDLIDYLDVPTEMQGALAENESP